jgi:hypothetical protein
MALQYYNRYSDFLINGQQTVVPFIQLPTKSSDKAHIYIVGQSRLDKISQQYYNSPFFNSSKLRTPSLFISTLLNIIPYYYKSYSLIYEIIYQNTIFLNCL